MTGIVYRMTGQEARRMNQTKNDLSFNEAKLDFEAMLLVSQVACFGLIESVSRGIGILRSTPQDYLTAERLQRDGKYLVTASETLATLLGAKEREILTIVNKP